MPVKRLPTISSQMLDAEDIDRPQTPSLNVVTEDEEEEIFFKVKEDSELQDRSLGTNQSQRSGSTFSLPGRWSQNDFLSHQHLN